MCEMETAIYLFIYLAAVLEHSLLHPSAMAIVLEQGWPNYYSGNFLSSFVFVSIYNRKHVFANAS